MKNECPAWRGNVSKFPGRILTRASSLVTSGWGHAVEVEDKQADLPRTPVPELERTLQRYLEAIHPLVSPSQYERAQELSKDLLEKEGAELQHHLYDRRLRMKNWVFEWWLNDMYMNNPACLPINSNPGGVWPPQSFPSQNHQLQFASKLTTFILDFKDRLDRYEVPIERAACREPGQPLCMAQHYRLMTTYRVPGLPRDNQRDTTMALVDHIIVIYRKHFFSCPIRTVERRLTTAEILEQFKAIVQSEASASTSEEPVGILTSQRRPIWADERVKLLADETNKQSLEEIETCHFIVCLDDPLPAQVFNSKVGHRSAGSHWIKENGRDETSMLHQMLHGGGSKYNTANRWFDKTMQFIVSSDGVVGLCYEHSAAEGIGILNLIDDFYQKLLSEPNAGSIAEEKLADGIGALSVEETDGAVKSDIEIAIPIRLEWVLSPDSKTAITEACQAIDGLIQDLDLAVLRYDGYGKDFIKKCRVSPDVYTQLALQLAYYGLHDKMVATYESASTRRFKLGRVDCIRSTTMEALEWVKAMKAGKRDSGEELIRKFHLAVDKQTTIMVENITGEGIDVHLLGLRQQALELGMEVPQLFQDETFRIANHFALSTSQLPTKENQFMGYGPVVPDGYGASYNPMSRSIIFCISSFTSDPTTSTTRFCQSLHKSLDSMKSLLED